MNRNDRLWVDYLQLDDARLYESARQFATSSYVYTKLAAEKQEEAARASSETRRLLGIVCALFVCCCSVARADDSATVVRDLQAFEAALDGVQVVKSSTYDRLQDTYVAIQARASKLSAKHRLSLAALDELDAALLVLRNLPWLKDAVYTQTFNTRRVHVHVSPTGAPSYDLEISVSK